MVFKKIFFDSHFLRKSLFRFLFFTNAFAAGTSLEERARQVVVKYEEMYRSTTGIQRAVLKNRITNEKEKNRVGNEVATKIRLLAIENVSSNTALYNSSGLNIRYDMKSKLIPLVGFHFLDQDRSGSSREVYGEQVKLRLLVVEAGEKFKVLEFLEDEKKGFDRLYILSNSSNKKYVIRSDDYEKFFEIKPLVKDDSEKMQAYLNKTQANVLKKNNGFKAVFCADVQDYRKDQKDRASDEIRIGNFELDDPSFKEVENSTIKEVSKSFNDFRTAHLFKADEPITLITSYQAKKICYGVHFKEKESFLTVYYFLPMFVKGSWKF